MRTILTSLMCAIILTTLSFMQGCATLNQSECQTANWEVIGLEDGANGRPSSFIGEHRKACAEYGIAPDLAQYLKGHQQGVIQYCSYNNGYSLGERGGNYNGVCGERDFPDFFHGYQRGSKAFEFISEIRELQNTIAAASGRLDEIQRQIKYKEDQIIDENTSRQLRRDLLEEVKTLNTEASEINLQLPHLQRDLRRLEQRYERFRNRP